MNSDADNLERITAPPGTPQYAEQFERQSQSAMTHFWRQPVIRFACALLAVLWAVFAIALFVDVATSDSWPFSSTYRNGYLCFGVLCYTVFCARIAWTGKT
jgi:hypothetical protein